MAFALLSFAACGEDVPVPKAKALPENSGAKNAATAASSDVPAGPVSKMLSDSTLAEWSRSAPAEYRAKFSTSKGDFTILVFREWAPRGADRFYNLVRHGYFDNVRFFRVMSGFMAQFGMHGDPRINSVWSGAKIQDDPVTQTNARGMVTFATSGKNSRTTQVFINLVNNERLDGDGFAPFGKVIEGMDVVDKLYSGYGEGEPTGKGPSQGKIAAEGNAYLSRDFKELDFVKTATIVQ